MSRSIAVDYFPQMPLLNVICSRVLPYLKSLLRFIPESVYTPFSAEVRKPQDCCWVVVEVMLRQMMKVLPTLPPVKQESGFRA